ncbi:MAG: hypothetical protein OXC62_06740 [Aestuariivita sp.]|nr:hypothetical protein [Aestuariivita sp.]
MLGQGTQGRRPQVQQETSALVRDRICRTSQQPTARHRGTDGKHRAGHGGQALAVRPSHRG